MKRLWLTLCLIGGALLLGCALLVPAHFRAVDAAVIERAGKGQAGLIEEGLTLLSVEKLGPARMLLRVAQSEGVPHTEGLQNRVIQFERENPSLVALGGSSPLLDKVDLGQGNAAEPKPLIELLTRRGVREKALAFLQPSRRPGVQQILKNRELTNTVHFPAAASSSGQALEAAIITAGLLFQGDYFTPSFRDAFEWLAAPAKGGGKFAEIEPTVIHFLSIGRRLDWVSVTELMKRVENIATLRNVAEGMRAREESAANIFAAVILSGNATGTDRKS